MAPCPGANSELWNGWPSSIGLGAAWRFFFHCASAGGPAKLSPGGPSPDILFPPSAIFCHGCHMPGTCSSSIENDAWETLDWDMSPTKFCHVFLRFGEKLEEISQGDGASNGTLQLVEDVLGIAAGTENLNPKPPKTELNQPLQHIATLWWKLMESRCFAGSEVWSSAFSRCLNPYCLAKIHGLLRDLGRLLDGVVHVVSVSGWSWATEIFRMSWRFTHLHIYIYLSLYMYRHPRPKCNAFFFDPW